MANPLTDLVAKSLEASLKRKQEVDGVGGDASAAPSSSASSSSASSSSVEYLAVSLLESSSCAIRKAVGQNLPLLLQHDQQQQDEEEGGEEEAAASSTVLTKQELEAVLLLARSQYLPVSTLACQFIATHLDAVPRGKMGTMATLQACTTLLHTGLQQQQEGNNRGIIKFALLVGTAVAKEGTIWAQRLGESWASILQNLLEEEEDEEEEEEGEAFGFRLDVLRCCAALNPQELSPGLIRGCLQNIAHHPHQPELVLLACDTLIKPTTATATDDQDEDFRANEDDVRLLLDCARAFTLERQFAVTATLLRVLHARSVEHSTVLCDLFEECEVMDTVNALYRSSLPAGKLECALFLEALLCAPPSTTAQELSVGRKVHLCECGLVVRLIRLASPSSSGSSHGVGGDAAGQEFLPAIRALAQLAKVERIGARIVLAGGLGPLFSHANSNRNTRVEAKRALAALGVTNLGIVVESWIKTFRTARSSSNSMMTSNGSTASLLSTAAAAEEEAKLPLTDLVLYNGKRLVMDDPPEGFFTHTLLDADSVLGRGAFSTVYKNKWTTAGGVEWCAVKRLTRAAAQDPNFAEEIRVLARIPAHPNIIGLYGVYLNAEECLLCSEFGGPTLSSALTKGMPWRDRLSALYGVSEALRHLHGLDPVVLHMDLKASNVLVVRQPGTGGAVQAKLCDFGLAVELRRGFEFLLPGEHGTIQYMAPEVMRDGEHVELSRGFDARAEVYSFAMVMWECAHPGRIPWQDEHFPEISAEVDITSAIRRAVQHGRRPKCDDQDGQDADWPTGYRALMEQCWRKHSYDRPSFVGNFFHAADDLNDDDDDHNDHSGSGAGGRENALICSTALRKMLWEANNSQQSSPAMAHKAKLSKWPSVKRLVAAAAQKSQSSPLE